jgi:peptidoglycan/LPS O-acetylase OafA/YrhL
MPLLFVLAGAASWYAFGHRTARGYVAERRVRLLVPFLFGLLVIVPPQTYLAQWSKGIEPVKGFFTFGGDPTGYTGGFTPAHLWFIGFLFLFSLGAAPLFARWRRRPVGARWVLFAMPVVLALANGLPAPDDGPQNPFYSLALFVGGYLMVADPRAERLVHRAWRPLLATAIATMTVAYLVARSGVQDTWADGSANQIAFELFQQVTTWVWVLALLGLGHRFLHRENRALRYANPAAYPFYLVHQTVIVAVAYVVVRWNAGLWTKFSVVMATSFVLSLATYELVRRTNATRFLVGLKRLPRPVRPRVEVDRVRV